VSMIVLLPLKSGTESFSLHLLDVKEEELERHRGNSDVWWRSRQTMKSDIPQVHR